MMVYIVVGYNDINNNHAKPMRSMNDFDQPLPSSCSCSLPVPCWMPRGVARPITLLTTPQATLTNTFVAAYQQSRLGEHVVHGGDAPTE